MQAILTTADLCSFFFGTKSFASSSRSCFKILLISLFFFLYFFALLCTFFLPNSHHPLSHLRHPKMNYMYDKPSKNWRKAIDTHKDRSLEDFESRTASVILQRSPGKPVHALKKHYQKRGVLERCNCKKDTLVNGIVIKIGYPLSRSIVFTSVHYNKLKREVKDKKN